MQVSNVYPPAGRKAGFIVKRSSCEQAENDLVLPWREDYCVHLQQDAALMDTARWLRKKYTGAAMRTGLVMVNTGNGKGKSTAAFGALLRAWGRGMRVCVIQFIKSETGKWGELKAAQKLGIEWHISGDGFTWRSKDMDESQARAMQGWELAQEKIIQGQYDLIVLDEFTYPLQFGWVNPQQAIDWLKANKPADLHLIITGRGAIPALLEYADLVSEMEEVKHPYQKGIQGQPGVEF